MENTSSEKSNSGSLLINLEHNWRLIKKDDRPYLSQEYVEIILYVWNKIWLNLKQNSELNWYETLFQIIEELQKHPNDLRPVVIQQGSHLTMILLIRWYTISSSFSYNSQKTSLVTWDSKNTLFLFMQWLIENAPDFFQKIYNQYEQFSRDYKISLQDLQKSPAISKKLDPISQKMVQTRETVEQITRDPGGRKDTFSLKRVLEKMEQIWVKWKDTK